MVVEEIKEAKEETVEVLEGSVEVLEVIVVGTNHMRLQTHQPLKTAQKASTVDSCSQQRVVTLITPKKRLTYRSKSTS